jgi:hypothetical protein
VNLPQVFISYAHQDQAAAEGVCSHLETNGILCWLASRDIRPGAQSWAASIINAIGECRVLVVLFSLNANRSRQMARELARADELGLPIIPLRLENVKPEGDLAFFLGNIQWLDMSQGNNHYTQQLVAAIRALIPLSRDVPAEKTEKRPPYFAAKREVYLCCRSNDATSDVAPLYDRLSAEFPGCVSSDHFGTKRILDFFSRTTASSVVLVIIGKRWLTLADAEGTPLIQSPNDFIRSKIASSLEAQARIIPILVDGAEMPSEYFLPADIGALARIKPVELTGKTYDQTLALLIEILHALLDNPTFFR